MTAAITGLSVAYAFLVAIVLNLCFRSPWSFWIKLTAVIFAAGLYFVVYNSIYEMLGWPNKTANLPSRFELVSAMIIEPPKRTLEEEQEQTVETPLATSKGNIFIWVLSLEGDTPDKQPRAFEVPYSVKMHKVISAAIENRRQGIAQVGEVEKVTARGEAIELFNTKEPNIKIHNVANPELPGK